MNIRFETPQDIDAIAALTAEAFLDAPHSSRTEHFIVNALRAAGRLSVSLVAVDDGEIIGHIAMSPVSISSGQSGWFGLGPLSVKPSRQREGIGSALATKALAHIQNEGASGCVVLGDPRYYSRFGFKTDAALVLPGVPAEYFQALAFHQDDAHGTVSFDDSFNARA